MEAYRHRPSLHLLTAAGVGVVLPAAAAAASSASLMLQLPLEPEMLLEMQKWAERRQTWLCSGRLWASLTSRFCPRSCETWRLPVLQRLEKPRLINRVLLQTHSPPSPPQKHTQMESVSLWLICVDCSGAVNTRWWIYAAHRWGTQYFRNLLWDFVVSFPA